MTTYSPPVVDNNDAANDRADHQEGDHHGRYGRAAALGADRGATEVLLAEVVDENLVAALNTAVHPSWADTAQSVVTLFFGKLDFNFK